MKLPQLNSLLWSQSTKMQTFSKLSNPQRRLGKDPNLVYESSQRTQISTNFSCTQPEIDLDSWWNGPIVVCKGDNSSLR